MPETLPLLTITAITLHRIACDWRKMLVVPDGLSYEEASTLFITYPTSYAGLVTRAKLQKGGSLAILSCQFIDTDASVGRRSKAQFKPGKGSLL